MQGMSDCQVVGVVTAPEKICISYNPVGFTNVLHGNVQGYCEQNHIPYVVSDSGMNQEGLFESAQDWNPDAFIVVGWYHMVPRKWRELAPCYGMHASLLPDYSGGAPLVWAMINGEKRTGITLFQFADGVDNGPIVGQCETEIFVDDNIASLYDRIEDLGLDLMSTYCPKLANGTANFLPQDEKKRRIFPQRCPDDGKVDWSRSAREVHDFIRAQTKPYPGAFSYLGDTKIYVWSSMFVSDSPKNLLPSGGIYLQGEDLLVGCGDILLKLKDVSLADSAILPADLLELGARFVS